MKLFASGLLLRIKWDIVWETPGSQWMLKEKCGHDAFNTGPHEKMGCHSHDGDHPNSAQKPRGVRVSSCSGYWPVSQLKKRLQFSHGPQRRIQFCGRVLKRVEFSAHDRRPFATQFSLGGEFIFLLVRNFSSASIIEIGLLGHWVNIMWPVSHPGQGSTFYQVN